MTPTNFNRSKYPYVYPIVGGRNINHLKGNIEALGIELSAQDIADIDSAIDFDIGFPMNFLFEFGGAKYDTNKTSADVALLGFAGNLECPPHQQPVKPHGLQGYGRNQ